MAEEICGRVLPHSPRSITPGSSREFRGTAWVLCLFVALLGIPLYVDRLFAR